MTHLEIEGLDAQGRALAEIDLTVGPFVMTADDRGPVDGRRLRITVLGKTATHESEGRGPLDLPAPFDPDIATVLDDPTVAVVFEAWDIQFAPRHATVSTLPQPAEVPYILLCEPFELRTLDSSPYTGCSSCTFSAGSNCADSSSCGQFRKGDFEYGEYRCCPSAGALVERACTVANSMNSCGKTGMNGCSVCWTEGLPNGMCRTVSTTGGLCQAQWCDF
jgi:hypothetical protein